MLIGIDIGGSKIEVAGSHVGADIEHEQTIATPKNQRVVVNTLNQLIREIVGRNSVDAIGISCPGPIDRQRGMVLNPRNLDWHNLKLVEPISKEFNCPVVIEHDASCGGMAEAKYGSAKGLKTFVYITLSTGIGTAIMVDGRPLPTPHNSEGGRMMIEPSLETVEGRIGTFESMVSGQAIVKRFGKIAGEITDKSSWEIIAHELSLGFYNIITLINPDALVLAGGVSLHHKKFLALVEKNLAHMHLLYPLPKIMPAKFILDAPVRGAIILAAEAVT